MKNDVPKVSIGLPVYNGEKYLSRALDSLLRQDYQDFELIISDNASTDSTSDICRSYAQKDPRIRYYRNETNLGAARNFNDVLKLARGQYFKWAAYDDECYPSLLQKCVEVLDKAPGSVILAYSRAEIIDSEGRVCGMVPDRANIRFKRPHLRMAKLLFSFHFGGAQHGVFRTEVIRQVRPLGTIASDRVMLAEVAMRGEIWEVPEVLFRLRLHPENALAIHKSRRQIEAWNDPGRKNHLLILPYELAVLRQHWKSVGHVRLGAMEKAFCFAVPVVVPVCRRLLRWKGRIAGWLLKTFSRGSKTTLMPRANEWVEVLSKEEILATLDKNGQLDGLPFMPQMFRYCGRQFKVYKRAHKSCDTVNFKGGIRMTNAVHLEGMRCDGEAYGGCQALCLIYWKTAWLKPVHDTAGMAGPQSIPPTASKDRPAGEPACAENDVWAGTQVKRAKDSAEEPTYICQATQMPYATTPLRWWDVSQYLEDYTSGNTSFGRMFRGFLYSCAYKLIQSGIGLGGFLRWSYDRIQSIWGGVPYPRKTGTIPLGKPTPDQTLSLQPGELVRVKSYEEILATLNEKNKNRGLYFDAESVPFCGKTYRVLRRVSQIIDEKTGKMVKIKNDAIILEDVYCQARYSSCRLFCPRAIYPYWREIWLERVEAKDAKEWAQAPVLEGSAGAAHHGCAKDA